MSSGDATTTDSGRENNAHSRVKTESSGSKNRYQQQWRTAVVPRQTRFEGKCEGLKGHIYDCSDAKQSDMFTRTTKEIAEYAGRNYKYGGDIRITIENMMIVTLTQPVNLAVDAGTAATRIWEKKLNEFVKRENCLEQNLPTIYLLVLWGQCTEALRQRIEGLDTYREIKATGDGLPLLMAIKDLVFNFQSQKYLPHALYESTRRLYHCQQGRTTTQTYLEQFQNVVDVIEHSGGSIGEMAGIENNVMIKKGATTVSLEIKKEAQEQYLAIAFMLGSDRSRYDTDDYSRTWRTIICRAKKTIQLPSQQPTTC
jgi:hypothetical protein